MPAQSKNQQIVAAMALHHPEDLYERNKGMAKMGKKDLRHFAETKRKGLPKKKRLLDYK